MATDKSKTEKKSGKLRAKIAGFFETRHGRALLVVSALALAYIFASWAIDSGSLLDWAITAILLVIAGRELSTLVKQTMRNK